MCCSRIVGAQATTLDTCVQAVKSTVEGVTDRDRRDVLGQPQKRIRARRQQSVKRHHRYSELLLPQLSPTAPLYRDVEEIRHAGPPAAVRTRQLLAFSRKRTEP